MPVKKKTAAQKKAIVKKAKKKVTKTVAKAGRGNKMIPQLEVVRSSRTKMTQIINESHGRFFTSTHIDKDGNPRTMNGVKAKNANTELGYIRIYVPKEKGFRLINPQTLTDLMFKGKHYRAPR